MSEHEKTAWWSLGSTVLIWLFLAMRFTDDGRVVVEHGRGGRLLGPRRPAAHVHQHGAVAVQTDHLPFRFGQGDAHGDLRGMPHPADRQELPLMAVAGPRGLACLLFMPRAWEHHTRAHALARELELEAPEAHEDPASFEQLTDQLADYFVGRRTDFDL